MNLLSSRIAFFLAGLLVFALAGCGRSKAPDQFIEVGRKLYREHNYLKAKEQFVSALSLRPDSRIASGYYGKILFRQGQLGESYRYIDRGLRAMTNDVELHQFKSVILAMRRSPEAPEFIRKTLALSPTNDAVLMFIPYVFPGTNGEPVGMALLQELTQRVGEYPGYDVARAGYAMAKKDARGVSLHLEKAFQKDREFVPAHTLAAQFYLQTGRTNLALESYKKAASLSPPNAEVQTMYASALQLTGKLDEAAKVLDEVIRLAPERTLAYSLRAEVDLALGNPEKSLERLKAALSLVEDDYNSRMIQAKTYLDLKQASNAVESLSYIVQKGSRNFDFNFTAALGLIGVKQYTKALLALERAAQVAPPGNYNAHNLFAELKIRYNRPADAIEMLERAINSNTNAAVRTNELVRTEFLLATAYANAGKLDEALEVYEGMKQRGISSSKLFHETGKIHRILADEAQDRITEATESGQNLSLESIRNRRQREVDLARRDFRQALKLNTKSVEALNANIDLELREGNVADAKSFLEPFIRDIDTTPLLLWLRARVSLAENKRESAEADLGRALDLDPAFYPAYQLLAEIYLNAGDLAQSLNKIDLVLTPQSTNATFLANVHAQRPRFLLLRGMVCSELGRHEEAVAAYRELVQGGSQNLIVLNNLASALSDKLGRFEEARPFAKKVLELAPDNFLHSDTFGWIEYRRGDYARALELLEQSQSSLANRSFSLFAKDAVTRADVDAHYGNACYMMGLEDAAFTALSRARTSMTNQVLLDLSVPRLEFLTRLRDPATKDLEPVVQARLQQDPKDVIALLRSGQIREAAGNTAGALENYTAALQINPRLTEAILRSAQLQVESAPTVAAQLARRAQAANASDPRIEVVLGQVALNAGDIKRALTLLQSSVQSLTNNAGIWYDLARAEFGSGNLAAALAAADAAIRLRPPDALALNARDLADWIRLARDPAAAAAAAARIEAALKTTPNNLAARYAQSVALTQSKKAPEARDLLEAIRKSNPEFLIAARDLALLYGTTLENDAKALEFGGIARARFQDDAALTRVMGLAAHRRGDHRYAAQLLSELVDNGTDDAEIQFRLGSSLFSLRRFEEARAALQKAISLAPKAPFVPDAERMLKDPKAG